VAKKMQEDNERLKDQVRQYKPDSGRRGRDDLKVTGMGIGGSHQERKVRRNHLTTSDLDEL